MTEYMCHGAGSKYSDFRKTAIYILYTILGYFVLRGGVYSGRFSWSCRTNKKWHKMLEVGALRYIQFDECFKARWRQIRCYREKPAAENIMNLRCGVGRTREADTFSCRQQATFHKATRVHRSSVTALLCEGKVGSSCRNL